MRAPQLLTLEMAREGRGQHDPGEVVVGQRGMADVGREQHLLVALAGQEALRVGELAVLEGRVDLDLVVAVRQLLETACGMQKPQFSSWYEVR